jgi:hypothetical protein
LDVEAVVNQRKFVRKVFQRLGVSGSDVSAITPKPLYAPLFVIDQRERFGGDLDSLQAGSRDRYPETSTTTSPRPRRL